MDVKNWAILVPDDRTKPTIEEYVESVTNHKQVVSPHLKLFPNSICKMLGGWTNVKARK